MQFDIVIVGGGSAGCVLANRLSADPGRRVCLIEAGPDTPPEAVPPAIYGDAFLPDYFRPDRYWTELVAYVDRIGNKSPAEIRAAMTPRRYEQARVMGGGSSVNGQVIIRGLAADYAEWQALGADGWSFEDCLPYFKRVERDMDFAGPLNGRDGPIPVRRTFPEHWSRFALAFRDAVGARGIGYLDDCHEQAGDGCFPFARNNAYDHRVSAAAGYLDDATRRRPNLTILAGRTVEDILFDGNRASGVRLRGDGGATVVTAPDIVLAAGALHTPALMMRAGIGPGDHLQEMGIAVRADRRGVGANLQDHPLIGFGIHLRPEGQLAGHVRNSFLLHMRWSSGHRDCPPVDMKLTVSGRFARNRLGARLATVNFGPNKAYSKGFVRLAGPDAATEPFIAFNYLSDSRDLDRFRTAARFVHDILSSDPAAGFLHSFWPGIYAESLRRLTEPTRWNSLKADIAARLLDAGGLARRLALGTAIDSRFTLQRVMADETVMEEWIRTGVQGDWHPCGTCRMGGPGDPGAVVDPQGRVYGVEGLRVADASVMPSIPCANTNLTTMMIGEKMADHLIAAGRPR